jgi:hypothetical protein
MHFMRYKSYEYSSADAIEEELSALRAAHRSATRQAQQNAGKANELNVVANRCVQRIASLSLAKFGERQPFVAVLD